MKEFETTLRKGTWQRIIANENADVIIEDVPVYERPHVMLFAWKREYIVLYFALRSWADICNDADVMNALRKRYGENKAFSWTDVWNDPDLRRDEMQQIARLLWNESK